MKKLKVASSIVLIVFFCVMIVGVFIKVEKGNYKKYEKIIEEYSQIYNVDKSVILAICRTESNFNENALSNKGAVGVMQILPSTCSYVCSLYGLEEKSLYDAEFNVKVGILYFKYLLNKFNDIKFSILAYNAGEGVVLSWKNSGIDLKNVPFKETRNYYKKVNFRKNLYN